MASAVISWIQWKDLSVSILYLSRSLSFTESFHTSSTKWQFECACFCTRDSLNGFYFPLKHISRDTC